MAEEPKEIPLSYVPLYLPLPSVPSCATPPLMLDGEAQGTVTPVKSVQKLLGPQLP
jgi:hypothetical protein